jgi:type I restriction enzyme S subunit
MSAAWPLVPLGSVLTERRETPSPSALANGDIRIVAKIGFNDGKIQLRAGSDTRTGMILARPGDLVVSGINAAKGAVAIYGAENTAPIAATIHYGAYIPNAERIDVSFLWWLLRSNTFRELLLRYVPGGIKTELKAKRLLPVPVPLPPLPEQKRVVARIEELAGKIERAQGLRRDAEEQARVLRDGTARKILSSLPYVHQPIGCLVTVRGGGTPSKSNPSYWEGVVPWISPKDMKQQQIWDATDHISEEATHATSARLLDPGAVLIVTRGMILAHTVPSAVLRVPAAINQDMKALFPNDSLTSEYLCCALWAFNTALLRIVERSTHDTRKLETPKLCDFAIPVPPISEQQVIVAYLDGLQAKVDAVKALQARTQAELDALLPSLLDRAFRGEL